MNDNLDKDDYVYNVPMKLCPCGTKVSTYGPYPTNHKKLLYRLACDKDSCGWSMLGFTPEECIANWNKRG